MLKYKTMAKLIISEAQYNTILKNGLNVRLNDITDSQTTITSKDNEVIEEGYKEFILGAAMVLSQALGGKVLAQTGHNKDIADKAVKNEKIMSQIKTTLEDENKTKELADAFKEMGLKNPDLLLADNAEKVKDAFNEISQNSKLNYKLDTKAVTNLQALNTKIKQGYALKNKEVKLDTIQAQNPVTNINDTLDVSFGSDNFFITGGYVLTENGVSIIKTTIDSIKQQGGTIISVMVESSTDAERTPKYISNDDATGNITLAKLRNKSVIDLVSSLAGEVRITHREIPNNGADVVSTEEFKKAATSPEALVSLRNKTSEFRYSKLVIVAEFKSYLPVAEKSTGEIIKNYRFELVKVIMSTGNTKKIKTNLKFKHKKFKCGKKTSNMDAVKCFTF